MARLRTLAWLVAALLAGCSFDVSGVWYDEVADAAPGDIDATATIDAHDMPDSPAAPDGSEESDANPEPDSSECVTQCLNGNELLDCTAGGITVGCDLGCTETGGPHCRVLVPSNGATSGHLTGVSTCLTLLDDQGGEVDSDSGAIQIEGATFRPGGQGVDATGIGFFTLSASVAVLAVDCVALEAGSNLRITGTRALIILSRGDAMIRGGIDITGGCSDTDQVDCSGPGGGAGSTGTGAGGCAPGGDGAGGTGGAEAGGGGGGLGQDGADGGDGDAVIRLGGSGGSVSGSCPGATLAPLRGGSGGGAGGSDAEKAPGGGGGGALQISSLTAISFDGASARAAIAAGGAGGAPGTGTNGAGGGGAGGGVLLEAPSIDFHFAVVAANGGGGGGGGGGEPGQPGQLSTTPAAGGQGGSDSNAGGAGGAASATPQEGGGPIDGAGGGGGGAGIIRLNVPSSGLSVTDAVFSPQRTRGDPAAQ